MNKVNDRISALMSAVDNWLHAPNEYLERAVQRTVEEGYFSEHDVSYALDRLRESLREQAVREWADRSGLLEAGLKEQTVLCLHAGNLPLVGLQDAFAAILSGATYYGKVSRSDPYLLPVFLNEVKQTDHFTGIDIQWTHNLDDLQGLNTDALLFAGSEASVPGVMDRAGELDLVSESTEYLVRTAHFSTCYLEELDDGIAGDLVEAMFRYDGMGCRSVAVVISPLPLDEVKDILCKHADSYRENNPPHEKPPPRLEHRYAYNRSVNRGQVWLDHFLVEEGGGPPDIDHLYFWKEGDRDTAAELAELYGEQLQSIYVADRESTIPGWEDRIEPLSGAQAPPIHWRPDGIDTLEWLISR